MDEEPIPPPRGDEAELFTAYQPVLRRRLAQDVNTSEAILDDACAFAWSQLLRHQPEREGDRYKGWLHTVAKREAWRLDGLERRSVSIPFGPPEPDVRDVSPELADPRDALEERADLREAVEVLRQLPPRYREAAFLRAHGYSYEEMSDLTGDSPTRTGQLVRRANQRILEAREQRSLEVRGSTSPRADRLRELQERPPEWLQSAIGKRPGRKDARTDHRAWLRAALAIDDYRNATGFRDPIEALGPRPTGSSAARAHDVASDRIERYRGSRDRGVDLGR